MKKITQLSFIMFLVTAFFQISNVYAGDCHDRITNFSPGGGPFGVKRATSGMVKMWVPTGMPSGCKAPIVHYSNGTGATCSMYGPIMRNLAKYGILAICYESTNTGQGTQAQKAIRAAISKYPNLADATKIGFSGHSQGGAGTFTALSRAEKNFPGATMTGVAMQPAARFGSYPPNWSSMFRGIRSPVAMFNGVADTLVPVYYASVTWKALSQPKVWYTATGADSTHIPVPNNPGKQITVPWFYWQLLGNKAACQAFQDLLKKGPGSWKKHSNSGVPTSCN